SIHSVSASAADAYAAKTPTGTIPSGAGGRNSRVSSDRVKPRAATRVRGVPLPLERGAGVPAVRRSLFESPCAAGRSEPPGAPSGPCLDRRNDADGGTTRTAERRGRRNDADGGTTRTAERRGRRNDADGGTTRTPERGRAWRSWHGGRLHMDLELGRQR